MSASTCTSGLQKNGLSWSDYRGLNQIKREQLSPQSPVNKKGPHWGHAGLRAHRQEREIVEKAAGFGLPHDKICQLIVSERAGKPIDAKTLRSAFRPELDRGVAVADSAVANALYNTLFSPTTSQRSTASRPRL